jgi:hypothetical protein
MSPHRWAVSAFIVWHLAATVVASLPPSRSVARNFSGDADSAGSSNSAFRFFTPAIDRLGGAVANTASAVHSGASGVIGRPVAWYISLTGLAQRWAMFSNPPQFDRYWRTRYYVQSADGRSWMATELIGPSHPEDQIRLFQSYRDSYRDKVFEIALDDFQRRRKASVVGPGTRPEELPDDLAPIGRFFAARFAQVRLLDNERIVRTEIWIATVPTKPLGRPPDERALVERHGTLLAYYDGPIEERLAVPPYPPYHGVEREGDLAWLLEYYEPAVTGPR